MNPAYLNAPGYIADELIVGGRNVYENKDTDSYKYLLGKLERELMKDGPPTKKARMSYLAKLPYIPEGAAWKKAVASRKSKVPKKLRKVIDNKDYWDLIREYSALAEKIKRYKKKYKDKL